MATNDGSGAKRTEAQPARPQASAGGDNKATPPAESRRAGETLPQATAAYLGPKQSLPQVFGRYRVQKKLGGGGMGTVYLVENTELEREEALKVPHFGDGNDPQVRERFLREAKSAAKLDHANLCPVYDAGVQDGIYYLTMRLLKGKLFSDYTGKAQPARKAVEIVAKLAQALEAAHGKGVIHRDLKPSNVMMVAGVGPVVMDFGLAKQVRQPDQKLTQAGAALGTPAYMPPEQVNGDIERMGPASDVYSLGVILYELLTGRLPFEGTMAAIYGQILYAEPPLPSALAPGLDPALDGICRKAMAKAPADRYPSMKAFAAALMDFLRQAPATAGAGNLAPVTGDKADIFQIATVAPGPRPAGKTAIFQAETVAPGPRDAAKAPRRVAKATAVATKRSRPAAKPSKKRWLVAGAGVAVVLLGIIGLCSGFSLYFLQDRQPAEPADKRVVSKDNFLKLEVGMTLKELEDIIGVGQPAAPDDVHTWINSQDGQEGSWEKAAKEYRVYLWHNYASGTGIHIFAGFSEPPSAAAAATVEAISYRDGRWDEDKGTLSGAEPLQPLDPTPPPPTAGEDKGALSGTEPLQPVQPVQPANHVSKDNFLKLEVGMTLQELEDIIGVGHPAAPNDHVYFHTGLDGSRLVEDPAWQQAAKEYRVYKFEGVTGRKKIRAAYVYAGFSEPPAAAPDAKVEALLYRDGVWDEDKGTLSGAEK